MEEQSFALMLRRALTEYDFERIDIRPDQASVTLKREVYAEDSKSDTLEFNFSDPVLIKVLEHLKSYLPSM
ncbi:MAG: hypothetical protein K6T91_07645 [Firmicutes bacterium]|nr:hypothetical protein [Bacillota bacterium]